MNTRGSAWRSGWQDAWGATRSSRRWPTTSRRPSIEHNPSRSLAFPRVTDVPSEGMNGSLPWITCRRIIKKRLQIMACLSLRARYLRGSTRRRQTVSRDGRNWRLAWVIVFPLLISLRSFFFQQLLVALLLFTVVFVIAAALIALCIGIDYAADSVLSWAESQVRSIHSFTHHSVVLPDRFSPGGGDGAVRRFKEVRWQRMRAATVAAPNADGGFSRMSEVHR